MWVLGHPKSRAEARGGVQWHPFASIRQVFSYSWDTLWKELVDNTEIKGCLLDWLWFLKGGSCEAEKERRGRKMDL